MSALGVRVAGNSVSCDFTVFRATLWENGGPMVDLNDLVSGADMTLIGPTGISDRGEITGIGVLANGELYAFVMIPCGRESPRRRWLPLQHGRGKPRTFRPVKSKRNTRGHAADPAVAA